jgi:hypothetical protein
MWVVLGAKHQERKDKNEIKLAYVDSMGGFIVIIP